MIKRYLLFLISIWTSMMLYAQVNVNLRGQVLDENDLGLMGVNVSVKGSSRGIITDIDGNFSLASLSQKDVLVFSFVGYETQEVLVGNRHRINVHLKPLVSELNDVVVVAYGAQKKATLTGALSTVDVEKLTEVPVASVTNMLAGAVPGVTSVQTSGQPGKDAAALYIRGVGSMSASSSSPLVLVDGVERSFEQIDPNEIENMSILKDASATAVFGVRGANGVILITTKRGKSGKPSISFSSMNGIQQPMQYLKQVSSYDYARFWNIKQEMDGVTDPKKYFTREDIEAFRIGSDPIMHPSTNWLDYFFRDVFFQSKNNVSISGGTDDVRYFVSMGYMRQNGVLKSLGSLPYDNNFSMNRYNYRANLDFKLSPSTQMKLGVGGNLLDTREPNHDPNIKNPYNIVAIWATPMSGPGIVNGKRTIIPRGTFPVENTIDAFESYYGRGFSRNYAMSLNMDLELTQDLGKWVKGLSVSLKGAYDNNFAFKKIRNGGSYEYQEVYYRGNLDENGKWKPGVWTDPEFDKSLVYVPVGVESPLTYSETNTRDRSWYLEGRVNYNRTFGSHAIGGLLLYNQSRDYYPQTYKYLPRNYIGYVGRVTYGYQSKYLAEFNAGYNGSENFAPGKNRYGFFPSGSIGWVVTGEKFMEKVRWLDYLKLRASWGQVGNDKGSSRFMYKESIWEEEGGYSFGVNNPVYSPSFYFTTPGNAEVSWEVATKQNYGIDLQAFDNRLSLSVDYFFEHRKNILLPPKRTPSIIAMNMPDLNLGIVDNQGYEIALGWDEMLKNGLHYYAKATVSYAHNKIIYMDEVKPKYDYMAKTGGIVDRPTGLYKFVRLYQYDDFVKNEEGKLVLKPGLPKPYVNVAPGDCMYEDMNGNGVVDSDDQVATGYSTIPEYIFGLNAGLDYKGFHFDMQWTGATHVDKALYSDYRIPFTNAGTRGLLDYLHDGCWTPENQLGAKYPSPAEANEGWNYGNSTLWLMDSSYLRLKTLTIGYTFAGKSWLKALGAKSLGLMFTGYNLLTFSPMKFMDPESPAKYSTGNYPLIKVYSFGVNVKF